MTDVLRQNMNASLGKILKSVVPETSFHEMCWCLFIFIEWISKWICFIHIVKSWTSEKKGLYSLKYGDNFHRNSSLFITFHWHTFLQNYLSSSSLSSQQVDDTICSGASFSLHYRTEPPTKLTQRSQLLWDSNLNVNSPIKSWTTSLSLLLGCK